MDNNQRRRLQKKIDRAYDNAYRLRKGRRARYWYRLAKKLDVKLHGPKTMLHIVDIKIDPSEVEDMQSHFDMMLKLANDTYGGKPQRYVSIKLELTPEKKYDVALVVNPDA